MQNLDITDLKKMILVGCEKVISQESLVNSINVFPVPDSDTGSNLSRTLTPLRELLTSKELENEETFEKRLLQTTLLSSQGNSGIMLVSFLHGFLDELHATSISISDMARGARNGYKKAEESIQNPVKGTMLDVIEAFSVSLERTKHADVVVAFLESCTSISIALNETTNRLKLLTQYDVVDAGALGFCLFIYGMYEGLSQKIYSLPSFIHEATLKKEGIQKNVFEVISVMHSLTLSIGDIRDILSTFGDCLDILEIENKIKLHIHTDTVDAVKESLQLFGTLELLTVTDMRTNKVVESI